jgi:hypothetical protein
MEGENLEKNEIFETDKKTDYNNTPFPQTELREIEQYFFSENVIRNIVEALEYEENIICLGTPAVADGFYKFKNRNVLCLDVDTRFNYLPGFRYFDMLRPTEIYQNENSENLQISENFEENLEIKNNKSQQVCKPNVLIIDPPFFKMNLLDLYNCVEFLTKGDKSSKIIFAFVHREERALLNIFKAYHLQLTKFKLEYRHVDPTKWDNYALYSNCEFSKIKFVKNKSLPGVGVNENHNKNNKNFIKNKKQTK